MKLLPVALKVEGARVLIVGGGAIAFRKAGTLRECGANVRVISPILCAELEAMQSDLEYSARCFQEGDCRGHQLVFACTDDSKVNAQIAEEAKAENIWVQIADDATQSTLHSAATIRRDEICIGITTGGASPALARHLKQQVEECIGDEYAQLLKLMGERREKMKTHITSQTARAQLWRVILESEILEQLRQGRHKDAEELMDLLLTANTNS